MDLTIGVRSTTEDAPADVVTGSLVVEHELANLWWELVALPATLGAACVVTTGFRSGRPRGLDRVRRRAEIVGGDMRHAGSLGSGVRRKPWRFSDVSRRRVGMAAGGARLRHGQLTSYPRTRTRDRQAWPDVARYDRLEERKNVFRG